MARLLGTATITVLAALKSRVRYGLDITAHTGLQPATVYTSLRRLEKRGFVRGQWEEAAIAENHEAHVAALRDGDRTRPPELGFEICDAGARLHPLVEASHGRNGHDR